MKRFLQITSSSNDASTAVRRKIVDGDCEISGAMKPLPVKVATCTMRHHSEHLLGEDDLRFADCCLLDQWMGNDKIMYRFHSANQFTSQKSSIDEVSTANADKHDGYDVIAFDMDSTIIKTKSGKAFPTNDDDWTLLYASIKDTVQHLHRQHKYLAIISNQGGVKQQKISREGLQRKVDRIVEYLGVPVDFICSIDKDVFRKPCTGMWDFLVQARLGGVDLSRCLYVGDAAGRAKDGTRKKDFSDTDYKLALNVGIEFATPEQFFLGSTLRLHRQLPDPALSCIRLASLTLTTSAGPSIDSDVFLLPAQRRRPPTGTSSTSSSDGNDLSPPVGPEVVLMVAPPACGKSTLTRKLEAHGYRSVNQDSLGSVGKCFDAAEGYLRGGESVCVDNTNMDPTTRAKWVALAGRCSALIRCIVLETPKDVCRLLAAYRMLDPCTPPGDRRRIEMVVIHTYFKSPVYPVLSDGYYRIDRVPWVPIVPTHPQSAKLFGMFLE